jgi:hypothetical protein
MMNNCCVAAVLARGLRIYHALLGPKLLRCISKWAIYRLIVFIGSPLGKSCPRPEMHPINGYGLSVSSAGVIIIVDRSIAKLAKRDVGGVAWVA